MTVTASLTKTRPAGSPGNLVTLTTFATMMMKMAMRTMCGGGISLTTIMIQAHPLIVKTITVLLSLVWLPPDGIMLRALQAAVPNCRILPLRWGDTLDRMAEAFRYAQLMGADIVSNSWGWIITDNLRNAIQDISTTGRHGRGVVVLFAIGNGNRDQCNSTWDIASLDTVIAIGASNNVDRRSGYSSFGSCLDVLAPSDGTSANPGYWGQNADGSARNPDGSTRSITTTDRTGAAGYNNTDPVGSCTGPANSTNYTNCFVGTSSATPMTAGIVGLMLSANRGMTKNDIQDLLQQTAEKIDGANANYDATTGYSNTHGYGRVDACRAVLETVDFDGNACIDKQDLKGAARRYLKRGGASSD